MAIRCKYCGSEFDVTLFEYGTNILCLCGNFVTLQHEETIAHYSPASDAEDTKILEIKNQADLISFFIIGKDYPQIDIEIEKQKLQEMISEFFPEKVHLYDLIYGPRFKRLEEQFRAN